MRYLIIISLFLFSFSVQAQSSVLSNDSPVISIFPNPTSDYFTVDYTEDISKVEIFNIIGRHIKTFDVLESNKTFNVSNLAGGLYLIRITDGSGEVIATKRLDKK